VQPIKLAWAELDLFGELLADLNDRNVDEPPSDRQVLGLRVSAAAFFLAARLRRGCQLQRLSGLGIRLLLEDSEQLTLRLVEPLILGTVQGSDEIAQPVLRSIRTKVGDLESLQELAHQRMKRRGVGGQQILVDRGSIHASNHFGALQWKSFAASQYSPTIFRCHHQRR
jgi:hypothetical protein